MNFVRAFLCVLLLAAPGYTQNDVLKLEGAKAVAAAESNKNDLIALPPDQEVSSSRRAIIITAETKGTEVNWIVLNANPAAPVESLELSVSKTVVVFPNDQDDLIIVMAYTQVGGKLSKPVRHLCKVSKSNVDPNPTPPTPTPPTPTPPTPTPPAKAKVKHVTFVIDQAMQTPEIASIVTDQGIRKVVADMGAKIHTVTVNSDSVTKGGLSSGVKAAGGAPCIILQDTLGNITAAQLLTSVAAARQFIEQNQGR